MNRLKLVLLLISMFHYAYLNSLTPGRNSTCASEACGRLVGISRKNSNNEDLDSITQDIIDHMFELRKWKRKQRGPFRRLWNDFTETTIHNNITFVLKNLHEKKCVSSLMQQNVVEVYTNEVYIYNNQSEQQEMNVPLFSRVEITSHELNVSSAASVSVFNEILLPFGVFEVGFGDEFPNSNIYRQISSHPVNISSAIQRILIDPFSRMKITHHVYRYEDIQDYILDFELDDSSTIPDFVSDGETISLKEFIRKYFGAGEYGKRGLKLVYSGDKLFLRNFRANEKIINYGIDTEFGIPHQFR